MRRSTPRPKVFDGSVGSVLRYVENLPVGPTGCRLWDRGHATNNGYGRVNLRRPEGGFRGVLMHRLVWEQANGPIPAGLCVMHSCDTPLCVELAHLSLGTHADNMADMARKGRSSAKKNRVV